MEVHYTPGNGVLLARDGRWLLLAAGETVPPAALVGQLWHDLGRPGAESLALATLRRHALEAGWACLFADSGTHHAHGSGRVDHTGDRWLLSAGEDDHSGAPRLPLVAGVVAAGMVEIAGTVPADARPAGTDPLVIDGIPPEIMASSDRSAAETGPAPGPVPPVPEADGHTARRAPADTDHDRHTRLRAHSTRPAQPSTEHLQQATSDTVLAVRCPSGHLTDSVSPACRVCGNPVPPQEPQRVLRPPLGVLRLPDADPVPLDRPVVLGRQPEATTAGDWPHLVRLPHDSTYLSRRHLRIDLDGWHVLARDLGSRGGTVVELPGREPERIRPHEPYLLEHGTVLDLAGAYRLTFLTAPEGPA